MSLFFIMLGALVFALVFLLSSGLMMLEQDDSSLAAPEHPLAYDAEISEPPAS
jgi:hypothetical protein